MRARLIPLIAPVLLLLAACAPGAAVLTPPRFALAPEGATLLRVDPPGIGDGRAVMRLRLRATNDNPVGVRLAQLDGTVYLDGTRAADARFQGGVSLPARGTGELTLDVSIPLQEAPGLLPSVATLVAGGDAEVLVEAEVGLEVLGTVQRFPRFTLVRTRVRSPIALVPPRLRFDPQGSGVRLVSLSSVELRLAGTLDNPGPIGVRVRAPEVALRLDGAPAARGSLEPVAVPAGGSVPVTLVFRVDPARLGAALAARLQGVAAGVASLDVALEGAWGLDAPGVASRRLPVAEVLSGTLR